MQTTSTPAPIPPPLLKQKELEKHFGVSRWSVDRWVEAGCPVRRLPTGQKRFDLSAVNAWMSRQPANAA